MKYVDFYADTANGTYICCECLEDGELDDLYPVFSDTEVDEYPVCDRCGSINENVNFIRKEVREDEKPVLTINYDSGVELLSATDTEGNAYISYERDALAGEVNFCTLCGVLIERGWVCLDDGEMYCNDCVKDAEEEQDENASNAQAG